MVDSDVGGRPRDGVDMSEGCVSVGLSTSSTRVVAVGVDTADVAEVRRSLAVYAERYRAFLLSPRERAEQTALTGQDLVRDTARRWASKEAVTKVLGPAQDDPWPWRHVEVVGGAGRPSVVLHGRPRELAARLGIDELVLDELDEVTPAGLTADTVTVTAVGLRSGRTTPRTTEAQKGTP